MRVRLKTAILLVLCAGILSALIIEDWREREAARVRVSGHSETSEISARPGAIEISTRDSRKMLLALLGYVFALIMVSYFAMIIFVNMPLDSIALALAREDPARLKALMGREDEFGRIANMIDKFFRQKQGLLAEIRQRKETDEALTAKIKELEGSYAQFRDMQAKLVQSEKLAALGRFASGVAHEVKDPLAILSGGLEYLKAKMPEAEPELMDAFVKIREAVMRADIVVKDLMTFARPSKLTAETAHPNELVRDAIVFIELFRRRPNAAGINIRQELTDKDISVEVDKSQMQQALFNVLLNAIEATPEKGEISVRTYPCAAPAPPGSGERPACAIEISDTGVGIPDEDMAKIFEPFFTTKRDKKGTGLGLSVVKSIIDDNKGVIGIESEIDKGTTVRIILPVVSVLQSVTNNK
ncbi:MAG: ATP-binding protein [Candidatus Omnitrophota bacterium]